MIKRSVGKWFSHYKHNENAKINVLPVIYPFREKRMGEPMPTPGLDVGVLPVPFWALAGGRSSWLNTRAGSLFQVKATPGAAATTLEVVTGLMQVRDPAAFFDAK